MLWVLQSKNRVPSRVLRRGSEKAASRRCPERPLGEYDPLGAFEKVLRRVLRRCLAVGFRGREGSEKGS